MTFMQLEKIILDTGRKSDGRSFLACLLDAYDTGVTDVDAGVIEAETGLKKTNISAVAKKLSEAGVIDIMYLHTSVEGAALSALRNGRWSQPFYRLAVPLLQLYRRC